MIDSITNATITITWQVGDRQPSVSPSSADVSFGGTATWQITVPSTYTAEVNFNVKNGVKGPFPVSGNPNNPSRGVYDSASGNVVSAATDQTTEGTWKYDVLIYDSSHVLVSEIDPAVVIKN